MLVLLKTFLDEDFSINPNHVVSVTEWTLQQRPDGEYVKTGCKISFTSGRPEIVLMETVEEITSILNNSL